MHPGKISKRNTHPGRLLAAFIALAVGVGYGAAAEAAKYTAKVSFAEPADAPNVVAFGKLFDEIRKQTNGDVDFQIFGSSQLGGIVEVTEGLQLGSIQATPGSSGFLVDYAPITGIFDLPFVFRDENHAIKACSIVFDKADKDLKAAGFVNLGCYTSGGRNFISTFPIHNIDDIQGKKMRVIQNPAHVEMWRLAGASPTPIPFAEVYTSLQTRLIDFLDNNKANYYTAKLYEVAPYYTIVNHIFSVDGFLVSKIFWDSLPPDYQKIVADVMKGGMESISHAWLDPADGLLQKAVDEGGATVLQLDSVEPFKQRMQPMYDKFLEAHPDAAEVLDQIRAIN